MRKDITTAFLSIVVLTLLLGVAYPLVTTGVAQVLFPNKSDGSQITRDGKVVGSRVIGRDFSKQPSLFQSRPSSSDYSADATFFGNLGPNSKELADQTRKALRAYLERERPTSPGLTAADVPADAVQTSASGVDPHISTADAAIQARRVAKARGLSLDRVRALIGANTDGRSLGVLGEPGVNVLELNLALEKERP